MINKKVRNNFKQKTIFRCDGMERIFTVHVDLSTDYSGVFLPGSYCAEESMLCVTQHIHTAIHIV